MSMSRPIVRLVALVSSVVASLAFAAPAFASAGACEGEALSQPFAYVGDSNLYTPVPGQAPNNFAGQGWELSGGAQILTTTLSNGTSGQVLNLPSGSKAVSPVFCVTRYDPTARALVRDVVGAEGVFFYVSYEGTKTWGTPKNTGQIHGNQTEWTAVTPVNMQPENIEGAQNVRLTLIPGGKTSDFQVYDLYVDPRMR